MQIDIFLKKINQRIDYVNSLPVREIIGYGIGTVKDITECLSLTDHHCVTYRNASVEKKVLRPADTYALDTHGYHSRKLIPS